MGAPAFTWSASRVSALNWCNRKYFYNYYGYSSGWPSRQSSKKFPPNGIRSEEAREIYFFKKLTSIPLWLGSHIHGSIGSLLDGTESAEKLIDNSINDATAVWNEYLNNYRMYDPIQNRLIDSGLEYKIKDNPFFLEQLSGSLNTNDLDACVEKIETCLQSVIDSPIPEMFENARTHNLFNFVETECEEPWNEGINIPHEAGSLLVHTKIDCAVEDSNGDYKIFDWKTGAEPQDDFTTHQLMLYAAYLEKKIDKKVEDGISIEVNEVYLPSFEMRGGVVAASEILNVIEVMTDQSEEGYSLHKKIDSAMEKSPRDYSLALELCPPRPARTCASCNWQTYCEAGKEKLGS